MNKEKATNPFYKGATDSQEVTNPFYKGDSVVDGPCVAKENLEAARLRVMSDFIKATEELSHRLF